MAVQWIKFEHTTPDKPEIVAIAAALRVDHDAVVGKLLRLWVWADQNSVDGGAMRITEAFIDRLVNRKGFARAMRQENWLAGGDGALVFPNFSRHNGATAKKRAVENRAKTDWRDRSESGQQPDKTPDNNRTITGQNTGHDPDKEPDKCPALNRTITGQINGRIHGPDEDEEERPKGLSCADPAPPAVAGANFEALAKAEGSNVAQLTKPARKRIHAALKQLLAVKPDLQPEEIASRASKYPQVMPAGSKLTAHALAMHWAKCEVKSAQPPSPAPENWRQRMEWAFPGNAINREGRPWSKVGPEAWAKVLATETKKP